MTHFFKKPIVKGIITVKLSALAAGLACLFLAPVANNEKQLHLLSSSQISLVLKLKGGGSNESSELGPKMISNRRKMLKKHFPDWEERVNYEKKQEKNYRSTLNRIDEAKRLRVKLKLTSQGRSFISRTKDRRAAPLLQRL